MAKKKSSKKVTGNAIVMNILRYLGTGVFLVCIVFVMKYYFITKSNIYINISVWHENGILSYNNMKGHNQIRAFVFVDKDWNKEKYEENGLNISSMCGAYDKNGKMNHSIT